MPDITFEVLFDYSQDSAFPQSFPQPSVKQINPNDKDFAKACGWLTAWGKELTGIDASKNGGTALEGEWLFTRKHIDMLGSSVVSVTCNMDALNFGSSPIVASMVIDNSTRITAIIAKKNACAGNAVDIVAKVRAVTMPYPADYAWGEHPQRPNTYSPVSKHAPHISRPSMDVKVSTSSGYVCHVVFIDQNGSTTEITNPSSPISSGMISFFSNANTAATTTILKAVSDGHLSFSQYVPTAKIGKRYKGAGSKQQALPTASIDSTFNTPKGTSKPAFVKPDELDELPVPQNGYSWYANMRGVLFLEGGGQILWPHEVFDISQMYADLSALKNQLVIEGVERERVWLNEHIEKIQKQINLVSAMLKYMESVADGISLSSKAFGDFK